MRGGPVGQGHGQSETTGYRYPSPFMRMPPHMYSLLHPVSFPCLFPSTPTFVVGIVSLVMTPAVVGRLSQNS